MKSILFLNTRKKQPSYMWGSNYFPTSQFHEDMKKVLRNALTIANKTFTN